MAGPVCVSSVGPDDVAAVAAAAPLAAALRLQAGPFDVPTGLLASTARVESENSEAGAVTREFLREDPWFGMGSVHPGGWMLLARDDDTIVIGQRHDRVGLGHVVTLSRAGDRFAATAMGPARLITGVPGERIEAVTDATVDNRTLMLRWDCGADLRRQPLRRVAEIRTLTAIDAVHVLLVSVPEEDGSRSRRGGWHTGTGMTSHATVRLDEDLAGRLLLTDHRIPAQRLLPA